MCKDLAVVVVVRAFDVAVIGAGLSGLACASKLTSEGLSVVLVEANSQPGGRIRSVRDDKTGEWLGDLGPTWVWPDFQPGLKSWLDDLGLSLYLQQGNELTLVDVHPDQAPSLQSVPVQSGHYRVTGGTSEIVRRLVDKISSVEQIYGCAIRSIKLSDEYCRLKPSNGQEPISARYLVVATPPRLAAQLSWEPLLDSSLRIALEETPTWMASQAKVVLLYEYPFWREDGLSGRIMSRVGPLTELHDHSGPSGSPVSLTGFVGLEHTSRMEAGNGLGDMINAQLERLFGPKAPTPVQIIMKDWGNDPYACTAKDLSSPMSHPTVGPQLLRDAHYDKKVWFAAAETAGSNPGLIAGAFSSASDIARQIIAQAKRDE